MRLIDADALSKYIYENVPLKHFGNIKVMGFVRELIDNAPTVEPNKGVWIVVHDGLEYIGDGCSNCRNVVCGGSDGYNYCPNCGADMRGEDNEIIYC